MNSVGGFGQASYLLDRTTSVTGGYTYSRLWYPGVIRDTHLNSVSGGINKSLGRRTLVSASGGWSRFSATGATEIALDPLVAELLGTPTTIEIRSVTRNVLGAGARISHIVTDKISVSGRYSRGSPRPMACCWPRSRCRLGEHRLLRRCALDLRAWFHRDALGKHPPGGARVPQRAGSGAHVLPHCG